ncbi:DUF4124 domain-containing protein [Halomonas llamarensis]|uniref:DUF4124 domain-containing protein n=1 Tax=Halomonas llamarensis TaxID=2945104 RepID=A0ABT0SR79_9GAMM|nr:DUF4124 domain-containing protein [Halomonas llamarensis]MCL7929975.1 DUF4124 domain-containing protein [Halomonas llamarensis]
MQHTRAIKTVVLLSGVLLAAPLLAQAVYRVVDEQGRVTFTDNPASGGDEVEVAPLPNVSSSRTAAPKASAETPKRSAPGRPFMPYDRFMIEKPRDNARLSRSTTAVELLVSPRLRDDHQVRLRVNGEISQSALHSEAFWLANLPAGTHRLQAELLDSQGRVRHQTPPVHLTIEP